MAGLLAICYFSCLSVRSLWSEMWLLFGSHIWFHSQREQRYETSVSHAHCGRGGCSMRAAKGGSMGGSQAGRPVPHHWPNWERRAGLVMGSEVSLSPGITATRDQEVYGCGAAQARTSRQSGECLTRPLAALPPPSFDQGAGAGLSTGSQSSRRKKEATDPAGTLRALPVSCLTSKRRGTQPSGSQSHLGTWTPPSATSKEPSEVLCPSEATLRLSLTFGCSMALGFAPCHSIHPSASTASTHHFLLHCLATYSCLFCLPPYPKNVLGS